MDFEREQKQLLEAAEGFDRKNSYRGEWNKFKGDVAVQLVMSRLKRHLPIHLKLVGPAAYVKGFPSELDIMVVDMAARPVPFTSAYVQERVRCIIEVKYSGPTYWSKKNAPRELRKLRDHLRGRLPKKPIVWIFLREYKGYIDGIRQGLRPNVFILADWKWDPIKGEWKKFVKRTLSLL